MAQGQSMDGRVRNGEWTSCDRYLLGKGRRRLDAIVCVSLRLVIFIMHASLAIKHAYRRGGVRPSTPAPLRVAIGGRLRVSGRRQPGRLLM